jgi:hypothetical protein
VATYYLDYEGGNDSNDGTTFANRWKTVTSGATAARISPGDTIRIMASKPPTSVGNATWTNSSNIVTLSASCTQMIDNCDSSWTQSANVTHTSDTTNHREGSSARSLAIASGFTTGKIAYRATGSLNLSGYQQVSLWIRVSAAVSENVLQVVLCSDTTGDVAVNTINIPAIPSTAKWHAVTVDTSGALGSDIQSVALYAASDPGAVTVLLDCILACKASSSDDSLTLSSLIGKNTSTETWYSISSISGTTVTLDQYSTTATSGFRGYYGSTETVTTYKREAISVTPVASTSTEFTIQDSGTSGSVITYSGGWDRTNMSTQDGESWFTGANGSGTGINFNTSQFVSVEKMGFVRFATGISLSSGAASNSLSSVHANNNSTGLSPNGSMGIVSLFMCNNGAAAFSSSVASIPASITTRIQTDGNTGNGTQVVFYGCDVGDVVVRGNAGTSPFTLGLQASTVANVVSQGNNSSVTALNINSGYGSLISSATVSGGSTGISISASRITIKNATITNNTGVAISTGSGSDCTFKSLSTSSGTVGVSFGSGKVILVDSTLGQSTEVTPLASSVLIGGCVISHNHDGESGNHQHFYDGGIVSAQSSVRHTASGIAWQIQPTSSFRTSTAPIPLSVAKIAVVANQQVSASVWMRRSNTGVNARLRVPGGQIPGVANDVSTSMTASADTWEQVSLQFTPSSSGVVEFIAEAWGGTTHSVYVDDFEVSQ